MRRPQPVVRARARAAALPRPQAAVTTEWLVAAIAVALIIGALLAS